MRYHRRVQERAKQLRSEGKTYSEIKTLLKSNIPKSTLSFWCHGIALPKWFEEKVKHLNERNLSKAQKMAWIWHKQAQEKRKQAALQKNLHLASKSNNKDVEKMLLAMLYLGEGRKWKTQGGMALGSSDPEIIQIYLRLLKLCYDISPENLHCRISYRADQNIRELENYWSEITLIPIKNFYKTIPDPRTIGKPTKKPDYKGVCVVHGGSTDIQLELDAISKIILKATMGL